MGGFGEAHQITGDRPAAKVRSGVARALSSGLSPDWAMVGTRLLTEHHAAMFQEQEGTGWNEH